MIFYYAMTQQYWGIPLWGWIIIILVIVGLIVAIRASAAAKKSKAAEVITPTEVETGNVKLPETDPPKTPSPAQEFPRDAPLPPPAPSETSQKA